MREPEADGAERRGEPCAHCVGEAAQRVAPERQLFGERGEQDPAPSGRVARPQLDQSPVFVTVAPPTSTGSPAAPAAITTPSTTPPRRPAGTPVRPARRRRARR